MRVVLDVAFPADLLLRFFPNGKLGGLTVDGSAPSALGQLVELQVRVLRPPREFIVKGQLAWARHKGSRNLKECFGVDFVDDSSGRLLAFARQDLSPNAMRTHARLVTELPVRIHHKGVARREFLVDLSMGGAFVRSGSPLAIGETVVMHLRPPGAFIAMTLNGRVAWTRWTGEAAGMGLEFLEHDDVRERLDKLLTRLNAT